MKKIIDEPKIRATVIELVILPCTQKEKELVTKYTKLFFNEKRIRIKNKYGNNILRIRNRAFKRMFKKMRKYQQMALLQSMNRNKTYNMDVRREVEIKSFLNTKINGGKNNENR